MFSGAVEVRVINLIVLDSSLSAIQIIICQIAHCRLKEQVLSIRLYHGRLQVLPSHLLIVLHPLHPVHLP